MEINYLRFYPVSVLKRLLKKGEITEEYFEKEVKKEFWPKNLKRKESR